MSGVSAAAGILLHGGLGSLQSADFGKKGMMVGGAVGAAGFLAGETVDDGSFGGAVASGMISGSVQSAFSTAQELYAFKNPGHISAVSSINTTTTATATANALWSPFTKEGREDWKRSVTPSEGGKPSFFKDKVGGTVAWFARNQFSPENVMTDFLKKGMIHNDMGAGIKFILGSMGIDKDEGKFSPMKAGKTFVGSYMEQASLADNPSGWFSNKPVEFDMRKTNFIGDPVGPNGEHLRQEYYNKQGGLIDSSAPDIGIEKWKREHDIDDTKTRHYAYLDEDGKPLDRVVFGKHKKTYLEPGKTRVSLTGKETVAERMGMFIEHNRETVQGVMDSMNSDSIKKGIEPAFKTVDEYKAYLGNMEGGAHSTYKELERAGLYGKNAPMGKKLVGYGIETFSGSPAWARVLDKQIKKGTASIERGNHPDGRAFAHIKGGGKFGRIMGLVADIGMGGVLNAGVNAALYAASAPFKSKEKSNVRSNTAYNPI